jgi:hypothetical protein
MTKIKPLHIFGLVMSFAYLFFGLLILSTGFLSETISDSTSRKILGGIAMAYGLFRITYFFRKIRMQA